MSSGRYTMLLSNLLYSAGAFIFDWNETHVKNPLWPPHARFHNGQTMSMGVLLTLLSVYLIFFPSGRPSARSSERLFIAALVGSLYAISGLSAILYPGTDWRDPGDATPYRIQIPIFSAVLVGNWGGYLIACRKQDQKKGQ